MRDHFASILGQEHATENPNDLLAYSYDASGKEGKARLVVFPSTDEEVRKILTYVNRTNIPLIPRGLGSNTLGMVVPENAIVMDMARFDRIHTLNLKEGWVLVDCGVVAQDLQKLLLKHGYSLPAAPKSIDVSTIGAMLATNQMDRRSHKNGRLAEHVLSLDIIDGTGKHYPDGNKAFIGMEGIGAIILRAKIRILPLPKETTSDKKSFDTVTDVLAVVRELREDLTVLSLEYFNPYMAVLAGLEKEHYLFIEYASDKGSMVNKEQQERLWKIRDSAWDFAAAAGHAFIEDCSGSDEQLYDILSWCEDIQLPVASHIGMGIVHPFFDKEDTTDFHELLTSVGADASGQFGYGMVKKAFVPKHLKDKVNKLRDEYDYNNIINRGKLHDYS